MGNQCTHVFGPLGDGFECFGAKVLKLAVLETKSLISTGLSSETRTAESDVQGWDRAECLGRNDQNNECDIPCLATKTQRYGSQGV